MTSERQRPGLVDRLAGRREHHLRRSRFYRLLFALAGVIVTLTGIAMLVLPGPAFIVIPIGLAMLAMEFTWAERWLEKALGQAQAAQAKAAGASPAQKVLGGIATALGIAAFLAAGLLWDIPVLPV